MTKTRLTVARGCLAMFFCVPLTATTLASPPAPPAPPAPPYDLIIAGGHVIDGTGSPWYQADIGIRDGRIAAIGYLAGKPTRRTIEAKGMVVTPGFIDMLGQSEFSLLTQPTVPSKIFQGITTEITGEGRSAAPLSEAFIRAHPSEPAPNWRTLEQYFARLEGDGIGINFATYVGATQVRQLVLGDANVAPTPAQLQEMQSLVREAMIQGAMGVSSSLEYAPAAYASTEELIALASEVTRYGGIYASHIRTEGEGEAAALDEAIRIGREARVPVEIFHIKTEGKPSFGKMPDVVAQIEAARAAGVDVTADTYAYPAWGNALSAFIPPWAHDGGDQKLLKRLRDPKMRLRIRKDLLTPSQQWENEWQEIDGPADILIGAVQNPKLFPLQGRRLADVARQWKEDPIDALFDLLIQDQAHTGVVVFGISEPDITLALQQPWVSIGTDYPGASPSDRPGQKHGHPRGYSAFPRILRKYVREDHELTLVEAVRKFSALPAQRMHLTDRGVLKNGMWADIAVFAAESIRDVGTFEDPNHLAEGMQYVLVNGVPVIDGGNATGALPGKVLRGPGYQASPANE